MTVALSGEFARPLAKWASVLSALLLCAGCALYIVTVCFVPASAVMPRVAGFACIVGLCALGVTMLSYRAYNAALRRLHTARRSSGLCTHCA